MFFWQSAAFSKIVNKMIKRLPAKNEINENQGNLFPVPFFHLARHGAKGTAVFLSEAPNQSQSFVFGEKKKNVRQEREITFPR